MSGELGLTGWPAVAEEAIIARDVLLAEHVGSRLHVCHVSTRGSVEIIRWAKSRGINVTAEVTPHHLLLTDDLVRSYDPIYKVNPPLRSADDVQAVREALVDGTIDVVATDHAPHPMEDKECEWSAAAFGMLGLETALSVVQQTMVDPGLLTWAQVAERMSSRPAEIGRVANQGRPVAVGEPANLVLVDADGDPHRRGIRNGLAVAQHPVRGTHRARPGDGDVPARPRHRARRRAARSPRMSAVLVLEDGRTFHGEAYGAAGTTIAEVVFATGMTGYQETLTDPSYRGQIVVMTAPHIGNTGVNDEDFESRQVWVDGYVVRDPARVPSSWRSQRSLDDLLTEQGVVGISGIDTRALTRHLRERGSMRAAVSSETSDVDELLARVNAAPEMAGSNFLADVTTPETYVVPAIGDKRFTVAAIDLGIKGMTPRRMAERGIEVHVLPATSTLDDILAVQPDGVFMSNGPGDPATADHVVGVLQEVLGPQDPLLRDLPRQPDLRPRARPRHLQARLRTPRHQPAGAGPHHRQGRGHRAQPRVRRRRTAGRDVRHPVRAGPRHARLPQRRRRRGPGPARATRVQRPVPPGGRGRTARRRLPVRPVHATDG